ncbi:hypothetical protein [Cohaesibacter intestini]|uniref:hypothetical protein n=1 Tax=Cohaesibacter intestini TaxID=2211145 RepID=UPI000DEB5E91|nr:hypothetical protein [Cohaesibacter intestini]
MNKDQVKQVAQLWDQHGPVLNEIIRQDLCAYDLICARLWPRCDEIAKAASTEKVRLHFIDNGGFEFSDRAEIDLQIGVKIRNPDTDAFEITPLPILLNLEINSYFRHSIDIQLRMPDEKSVYFTPFKAALIPLRHRFKESDTDWRYEATLRSIELETDKDSSKPQAFNINDLFNQLPDALLDLNTTVLEPLAIALQAQSQPDQANGTTGVNSDA